MKLSFIEESGGSLPLDAIPSTHIIKLSNQNTYSNRRRGFQVHLKLLQQHINIIDPTIENCTNLIWLTTCNNLRSCRKSCGTRPSSPKQFCVSFFFQISEMTNVYDTWMNFIHSHLYLQVNFIPSCLILAKSTAFKPLVGPKTIGLTPEKHTTPQIHIHFDK